MPYAASVLGAILPCLSHPEERVALVALRCAVALASVWRAVALTSVHLAARTTRCLLCIPLRATASILRPSLLCWSKRCRTARSQRGSPHSGMIERCSMPGVAFLTRRQHPPGGSPYCSWARAARCSLLRVTWLPLCSTALPMRPTKSSCRPSMCRPRSRAKIRTSAFSWYAACGCRERN